MFEQIKESVNIANVIGGYITLKKRGNNFIGLCPFHSEKTPSFNVNVTKNFYHCFGCGAHGDVINFIAKIRHLDYKEAAVQLAEQYNLAVKIYKNSYTKSEELAPVYAALEKANEFFVKSIKNNTVVQQYLKTRNIQDELSKEFSIGYAPCNGNLIKYLRANHIPPEIIEKAGLIKQNQQNQTYEFFRNRIMFPIHNSRNKIIGFGSRTIDKTNKVKYLNSPETHLFKKSDVLFAHNKAQSNAYKKNRYILVEGYLDAISMHKIGLNETVASLGTAITKNQIQKLWNQVDEIVLCLDADLAGKSAVFKSILIAFSIIQSPKKLSISTLPNQLDPDAFIHNAQYCHMKNVIEDKVPASQYIVDHLIAQSTINGAEDVAQLEHQLKQYVDHIQDPVFKQHLKSFFRRKTQNLNAYKKNTHKVEIKNYHCKKQIAYSNLKYEHSIIRIEKLILKTLLENIFLLDNEQLIQELTNIQFTNENTQILLEQIVNSDKTEMSIVNKHEFVAALKLTTNTVAKSQCQEQMQKQYSQITVLIKKHRLETLQQEYLNILKKDNTQTLQQGYLKEIATLQSAIKNIIARVTITNNQFKNHT